MSDYSPEFLATLDVGQLADELTYLGKRIPRLEAVLKWDEVEVALAKKQHAAVEAALAEKTRSAA